MNQMRLTIECLNCHIHMVEGAEHPNTVRTRIARLAQGEMVELCREALATFANVSDDGAVYRIRRLHVTLWLDWQGMSEGEMARRWGRLLAGSVLQAMRLGTSNQVVRFDSPRHFVTAFLRDLLDGRAWSCWYYAEFRALDRLQPESIVVEMLSARPEWILSVLADFESSGHLDRLLDRWEASDVDRIWAAVGLPLRLEISSATWIDRALSDIAGLWLTVPLCTGADASTRARDRLRFWLAAAHTAGARAGELAPAIVALVDLAALLRVVPQMAPLLAMETMPYPTLLREIATSPAADLLGWLVPLWTTQAGRRQLARLVEVASGRDRGHVVRAAAPAIHFDRDSSSASAPLASPVGSVFLVVAALAETGLWERWQCEVGEESARHYLFVLLLKVLGREQAAMRLGDPLLTVFAGLEKPPVADVRLQRAEKDPSLVWASSLPEIAARWYPIHARSSIVGVAQRIQVVRETKIGYWLSAHPTGNAQAPNHPMTPEPSLRKPNDQEQATLAAEVDHLQLGERLGYAWLTTALDAALSAATTLVVRRTAARLPGFAGASLGYLVRQFLAQPATLECKRDALVVRLSGGPLSVVLSLADLPETLVVPWLSRPVRFIRPGALG